MAEALAHRRLTPLQPATLTTVRFYNPFFDEADEELNPHQDKEILAPSNGEGGVDEDRYAEIIEDQARGVLSRMTAARRFPDDA